MKLRKRVFLLIMMSALLIVVTACTNVTKRANATDTWPRIEHRKRVIIGLDDSFVPMGFRQKNGQLNGYDVQLAKKVFALSGIKADFQPIDWSMKETELRNGTIDLIWNGYTKSPDRTKTVRFSRAYLQNKQVLVTRKSSDIRNFADMTGKSLGVQNGSTGATLLSTKLKNVQAGIKNQTPILYDAYPDAFIDLKANRIQGILMDGGYADYYIQHQADANEYRIYSDPRVKSENFAVGMRKGDHTLQKKINQGLARLQRNGQLRELNREWFGKDSNYLGRDSDK